MEHLAIRRVLVGGIAVAVVIILVALLLQPAEKRTTHTTAPTCAVLGRGTASDCIRHEHARTPTHDTVNPGDAFDLQVKLHPSLAETNVTLDVEMRALTTRGPVGPWRTTRVYAGRGGAFARAGRVTLHAPKERGVFMVRTRVSWAAATTAAFDDGSAPMQPIAASENTAVSQATYVVDGMDCTTSSQDLQIVEMFNQMAFNEIIEIIENSVPPTVQLTINCDEVSMLPTEWHLQLMTGDADQTTDCRSQTPITIDTQQVANDQITYCERQTCQFIVTLSNNVTNFIYSNTVVQLDITDQSQTYLPELQPATIPACGSPQFPSRKTGLVP